MWTAAILAGGQARRLGGIDKSALVIDARSILDRQLSVVRALTPHVLIVAGASSHRWTADVPVVVDRIAGAGALGGLYTALIEAPTEHVVVI
jgi:molybdopterin-guanine dinucleotide biosynthesis protein A